MHRSSVRPAADRGIIMCIIPCCCFSLTKSLLVSYSLPLFDSALIKPLSSDLIKDASVPMAPSSVFLKCHVPSPTPILVSVLPFLFLKKCDCSGLEIERWFGGFFLLYE
uniref:Uncharacterized protein n=1 Tax=Cacopsylla melanoneura TaxID=428564 RepID=A0A8D8USV1_9HEMI